MKKEYRLKKKSEIDFVFSKKKSYGNKFFSIFYKSNDLEHFRFSMSIGRKYGDAHLRNKIKRQIRYIISLNKENIKNYDFVIVIKKDASLLDYSIIKKEIEYFLKKVKII